MPRRARFIWALCVIAVVAWFGLALLCALH